MVATSGGDEYSALKERADLLNPVVGFWDPLDLAGVDLFPIREDADTDVSIRWLRHAEIKHGRVAMAGFVGYCIHENGLTWLGKDKVDWAVGLSAPDIWDACPTKLKVSIFLLVAFLEFNSESQKPHYMAPGGTPGLPPSVLQPLFRSSDEKREQRLRMEINNGRLAMIGIFGLISASKGLIVPGLNQLPLKPYAGEVMQPFTAADVSLPFVADMLGLNLQIGA
jgi:hypothetical protein